MSDWSHDITAAPRGKTVHSERKVGDRVHQISDFVPYYIWAATQCDKVIKSYWIPPAGKNAGRWSGFANGEQPIAWQHFVVPKHPFSNQPETATKSGAVPGPGETAAEGNCRAVTAGETATQFYLEDVGGGA